MKKGFTLIELLAVIVILAIIALIATPIVLNIIRDTKKSALIRSSELYMDAVENSIANKMLKDSTFKIENGSYEIMQDGNICVGVYETNECNGEILIVESENQKPNNGFISFENGITNDLEFKYDNDVVIKQNNQFVINTEPPKEKWIRLKDAIIPEEYKDKVDSVSVKTDGICFNVVDKNSCDYEMAWYECSIEAKYCYNFDSEKFEKLIVNNDEYITNCDGSGDILFLCNTNKGNSYYFEKNFGPYYKSNVSPVLGFFTVQNLFYKYNNGFFLIITDVGSGFVYGSYYLEKLGDSFVEISEPNSDELYSSNSCKHEKLGNYYYNSSTHSYSENCDGPWTEMGKITYNGKKFNYSVVDDRFVAYYRKSATHYLLFYTTRLDNIETYDYKD